MDDLSTFHRLPADIYQDLCDQGGVPDPFEFLKQFSDIDAIQLGAVLRKHLCVCFRNGQQLQVEDYFERYPKLIGSDAEIDLAYSEFLLRKEHGSMHHQSKSSCSGFLESLRLCESRSRSVASSRTRRCRDVNTAANKTRSRDSSSN